MAYKRKFEKYGIQYNDAYHQVNSIKWSIYDDEILTTTEKSSYTTYEKQEKCECLINIFSDETARINRVHPLDIVLFKFQYDKNSKTNIIEQAYNAFKSHPDWDGGIDC